MMTVETVEDSIKGAMTTLKRWRAPDQRYLAGLRVCWPEVAPPRKGSDDWWVTYDRKETRDERLRPRPPMPTPQQITLMDRVVLDWLPRLARRGAPRKVLLGGDPRLAPNWVVLPDDTGVVVVCRAMGYSWRAIMRLRGHGSHEAARRVHRAAMIYLTDEINGGQAAVGARAGL